MSIPTPSLFGLVKMNTGVFTSTVHLGWWASCQLTVSLSDEQMCVFIVLGVTKSSQRRKMMITIVSISRLQIDCMF